MNSIEKLHALDDAFEADPLSVGVELQFDLADIVVNALRAQGITQRELARRAKMHEAYISRIIHGNANCQFDVAGKILFALGMTARLVAHQKHQAEGDRCHMGTTFSGEELLGELLKGETQHGTISTFFNQGSSGGVIQTASIDVGGKAGADFRNALGSR